MNLIIRIALLTSLLVASQSSFAAASFYRCKDAQGKVRYASSMPVECQGRDTEVLNEKGNVIDTIESPQTKAISDAREAEDAQRLKARNDQMQRDHVLMETYLAVADIERLRDQRLDLLEAQLKIAEQHIGTLQDRLKQLTEQSARFKPYNDAPSAPPLPDHIAEALVITVKSIAVDRETMQIKKDEQTELTANFARDIKRFKELKSLQ